MLTTAEWKFPLPRPHTGMMLGNGTTGLLVWGGGNRLKITIGRADFWDHRGGMEWTARQNYRDIRRCLEANDATGIKELFACATEKVEGQPGRPSVLPVGRLDIVLAEGSELVEGTIDLTTGEAMVRYLRDGILKTILIRLSMERQLFVAELPPCEEASVVEVPSWEFVGEELRKISFKPPVMFKDPELRGWVQECPADPALCVGHRREGVYVWGATARGTDGQSPRTAAAELLRQAARHGTAALDVENRQWWSAYWRDIPQAEFSNPKLDFIYSYGLYKFAGFTNPSGVPATLQGPWIEEHRLPPWSSDYHFNINVQMCYWPAYKANRLSHLLPMFEMVLAWRPQLRKIAKDFIGVDDGYMMPHAVDDRCVCMGGFWTGTIDHGCAAWIAQMMFQYYRYSGDLEFLRTKAYDFMKGTMRVYEAMLERRGDAFVMPVSVSPEYRGADMNAWGANASFQLAAAHRLCEDLREAAGILGEKPEAAWGEILAKLPKASLFGKSGEQRIGLWDGVDLEESHRHHSHMAGICPFDSIDHQSDEWKEIIRRTFVNWIGKGMGHWSGWCMPWASMLQTRMGNGRMAELILEIWQNVFTNEGHGTLHDVEFPGFSLMGAASPCSPNDRKLIGPDRPYEIMQMDAGMGAVTAVQDMLLHTRRGVTHVFAGVPGNWPRASFKDMPTEGGALVSGVFEGGRVREVTIRAIRKLELRLANPWSGKKAQIRSDSPTTLECGDDLIVLTLDAGESRVITPQTP